MGDGVARPTAYKPEYNEQARKLCMLGYTDAQLGEFFNVSETTINNWKNSKDGFLESLKSGKGLADYEVVESLYKRATGYEHKEDKIFNNNGVILVAETIKHYPPDTTAMIYWLKNRQPDKWRDKQEIEHSGEVKSTIEVLPDADLNNEIKELEQKAKRKIPKITKRKK